LGATLAFGKRTYSGEWTLGRVTPDVLLEFDAAAQSLHDASLLVATVGRIDVGSWTADPPRAT